MAVKIDYEKCCFSDGKCRSCSCGSAACDGCVEACPVGALKRGKTLLFDAGICIECGACIDACEHKAIGFY